MGRIKDIEEDRTGETEVGEKSHESRRRPTILRSSQREKRDSQEKNSHTQPQQVPYSFTTFHRTKT